MFGASERIDDHSGVEGLIFVILTVGIIAVIILVAICISDKSNEDQDNSAPEEEGQITSGRRRPRNSRKKRDINSNGSELEGGDFEEEKGSYLPYVVNFVYLLIPITFWILIAVHGDSFSQLNRTNGFENQAYYYWVWTFF